MALPHSIPFDPADPAASLKGVPEAPGVFALYAADPTAEPYLSKTPNLRRRLQRFLRSGPPEPSTGQAAIPTVSTKRLRLAHMVHRIEYGVTGSEFESSFCLYQASMNAFGERARRRLRLRPPVFLRMSLNNPYPRIYVTVKLARPAASSLFGPFPSRASAERYAEEMLNLFLLRRCHEDLHPDPAFPGCPYSEMKMCLAPCFQGCTDERYREESAAVLGFLETRGRSLLTKLEGERDAASAALEFERAAALHQRIQKVEAVARLAPEAVHSLAHLSGVLVQPAVEPGTISLFALKHGFLSGPVPYSTLGMRLPNERSGSSSLFPQPVAVEAVPIEPAAGTPGNTPRTLLESRLEEALAAFSQSPAKSVQVLQDHLALFTRWVYSPAARRTGEIVFASNDGQTPRKPLLRAIARVAVQTSNLERNDRG